MKAIFKSSLFIILLSTVMVGCNKDEVKPINNSEPNTKRELSEADIIQIGNLHNEYLAKALKFQIANHQENEMKSNFQGLNIKQLTENKKSEILNDETVYDLNYLKANLEDKPALSYIERGALEIKEAMNYDEISTRLNLLKEIIKQDEGCNNKEVALIFCQVSMKSAHFWLDEVEGGSGVGHERLAFLLSTTEEVSDRVKAIIAADGFGASGAFLHGAAVGALGGPITWGGLVAAVGFSAAWSSATTALSLN